VIRPAIGPPLTDQGEWIFALPGGFDPDESAAADDRDPGSPGETADDDGRYIPPAVPPAPPLDPVAKGAWAALFGGPGLLFAATVFGWQLPGWAELLGLVAFVTGFVILVSRLGDGPSRRDDPDQGAVV
jgi:hypothetical protein